MLFPRCTPMHPDFFFFSWQSGRIWIMWIGAYKVSRSVTLNLQSYYYASESVIETSLFLFCIGFICVNVWCVYWNWFNLVGWWAEWMLWVNLIDCAHPRRAVLRHLSTFTILYYTFKQPDFSFSKYRKHCESNVKLREGFLRHRLVIHLCSAGNNSGSPASFSPVSRLFIQRLGLLFGASCCRCPVDEMNVLLKQMRDPHPIDFFSRSFNFSSLNAAAPSAFFVERPCLFIEIHVSVWHGDILRVFMHLRERVRS